MAAGRSLEKKYHREEVKDRKAAILRMDKKISAYVKERDGNKCRYCGNTLMRLDVHHIIRRSVYGLRWDEKNLITLCLKCHTWAQESPMQFREWFCFSVSLPVYDYLIMKSDKPFKTSITNLLSKEIEIDKLCQG